MAPGQAGRARARGRTVAITGAGGYLGRRLVHALVAEPAVERVLAFDLQAPPEPLPEGVVFDRLDVRDPALAARLDGVDVVVHLAFVMDPIRDENLMHDVNVNGSRNVFTCAAKAGVARVVYTSSGVAYGAHPDNDFPLTEDSPLRANLDFNYAAHKLEVELVLAEVRADQPGTRFCVLRPAIVFGPHVDNAWSHQLELPALLVPAGADVRLQFVHEDDVAACLVHCVLDDLDGAYNLCPDDHVGLERIAELAGKRVLRLPEQSLYAALERAWRLGLGEAPAGMLHYVVHPWVMSPAKLAAAGFTCSRTSEQALAETLAALPDRLRLGRLAVDRQALRRGGAAAAALGLLAAGAAAARARRRG